MSLLLLLAGLALLRWLPLQGELVLAAALLMGFSAGLTLPDVDQIVPIGHRSALTHSLLPALALMVRRWLWPLAAGVALGLFLHLAADFFPRDMVGYATIKMPFAGSLGGEGSYWWIGLQALACLAFGLLLAARLILARTVRLAAGGFALLMGGTYLLTTNGGVPALLLLVGLGALAWRVTRSRAAGDMR